MNIKFIKDKNIDNILFDILTIACIIIIAIAICPKTFQNDTYYTIKCGEYIFENGIFGIGQDPFSWHDLSYTWPHWLYDLCMYIFYAMCGRFWQTGIYILTIVLTAILGISLYKTSLKISKNNKVVSGIATLFAMYLMKPYIAARAQLVTFILFVWEIFFIEKLLETNKKRYGVILLIIAFFITQLHCAVFPMFFVFALPYVAEFAFIVLSELDIDEMIFRGVLKVLKRFAPTPEKKEKYNKFIEKSKKNVEARKIKREKRRKNPYKVIIPKNPAMVTLIIFLIIAVFIGFLNPMGTGAFTYTYKIYQGNTTSSINEHLPLILAESKGFAIMLMVMFCILILVDIKVRLKDLLMIAGVLILAFNARRQVSLVVIMGMPILAKFISSFLEKYDNSLEQKLKKILTSLLGTIIVMIVITLIAGDLYKTKKDEEFVSTSSYPVEASTWLLKYMKENNISKEDLKLYNEYNYGSYLLFRGIPVFIDSRCDLYTPEFGSKEDIFTEGLAVPNLNSNYEEIFEKYGVKHVILYNGDGVITNLNSDTNYEKIYNDNNFSIYRRLNAE